MIVRENIDSYQAQNARAQAVRKPAPLRKDLPALAGGAAAGAAVLQAQGANGPAQANDRSSAAPPAVAATLTAQPRTPATAPAQPAKPAPAEPVSAARSAAIDDFVRDNAAAENRTLVFYDSDGGSRVGRALRGESELGQLTPAERDRLAGRAVQAWASQADAGRSTENVNEALAEAAADPGATRALVSALARPALDQDRTAAQGGASMATTEYFANTDRMLTRALETDATTALAQVQGAEAQFAQRTPSLSSAARRNVWATLADNGALPPATQERLTSAMLVMEDRGFANGNADNQRLIGQAVANARRPGDTQQDRLARDMIAMNVSGALAQPGARDMLFNPEIRPDLRMWAMDQVAQGQVCNDGSMFAQGWESDAISQAYAAQVTETYRGLGTDPKLLEDEALRNTIGQALALTPDQLPSELTPEFLAKGMNYPAYSAGGANAPINAIAQEIRNLGGDQARVSIIPITVTSKDEGAATVPLFRVETADGPQFVDHNGDHYMTVAEWEEGNTLPEGRMTYAQGLDLHSTKLTTGNTPGVVDSFAEGFGKVMDGVALGAGLIAGGAAIFFSGGTATPLVVAAGTAVAGGWGAYRATEQLSDLQGRGRDLGDLSDPDVRSGWLNLGASVLSIGAVGSATRIASSGAQVTPSMARAVAGTQVLAEGADAAAMADATVQAAQNWDRMAGAQKAGALLNIAFWGGMTGAAGRAGGHPASQTTDFNAMRARLETGTGYPLVHDPQLQPGQVAVRYSMPEGSRPAEVQIAYGGDTVPGRATLARHDLAAQQVAAGGGLRDRLSRMVLQSQPPVGSQAWEADIEIRKMQTEAADISRALSAPGLTMQERATLESRQLEISEGLRQQGLRLDGWDRSGDRQIGDAARGVDQARGLGWPAAPDGYIWVAGDVEPHLRRTDTSLTRLDYDAATGGFVQRLDDQPQMRRTGHGTSEVTWNLDEDGNLTRAQGTLREFWSHAERSSAEVRAQGTAAARGNDGDQGGHAVGHRFVLDQGLKNLFPQEANFNMGAYRSFEDELAAWIARGYDVNLTVEPGKWSNGRPGEVRVAYDVVDPDDPSRVIPGQTVTFVNGPNQTFTRLTAEEMDRMVNP